MPYNLIADIQKEITAKQEFHAKNKAAIEELDKFEPVWEAFLPGKVNRYAPTILIVNVERLKDVEPVLALLTHDDLSFTDSGDKYAAANNRDYRRSDGVTVCVYVTGTNCRKEVVGNETVPVYKLVCDDDQPTIGGLTDTKPASNDDLPF